MRSSRRVRGGPVRPVPLRRPGLRPARGLALLVVPLLGACSLAGGDGEDGGSGQGGGPTAPARPEDYVEALAGSLTGGDGESGGPFDDEMATCVATRIVDVVGVDTLDDAGVTSDGLAEADSLADVGVTVAPEATGQLSDALGGCDVGATLRPALLAGLAVESGVELPADAAACLEAQLSDGAIAASLAASFLEGGGEGARAALGDAIVACPEAPAAIILGRSTAEEPLATEECVIDFLTENPDGIRAAFVGDDLAAAEELGADLAAVCPVGVEG